MNRSTVFFRLLADENKGAALADAIDSVHGAEGQSPAVYQVNPGSFRLVPTAPFAYWVSESIRRKFVELPPFEGDGRAVRQGLATADDFRFVRAWWEVAADRVLDGGNSPCHDVPAFQAWCRKRTYLGKRWVPFAKGGEYSPFFADTHLLVGWQREGEEMKAWASSLYNNSHWSRIIKNVEHYFRPGLTWPRRTQGGLSIRAFPMGCVFADKGPVAFAPEGELAALLGLSNSTSFFQFINLQMTFGSYEVGVIQRTPLPLALTSEQARHIAAQALACARMKRDAATADEVTHAAVVPAVLRVEGATLGERQRARQEQVSADEQAVASSHQTIDDLAAEIYGVTSAHHHRSKASRSSQNAVEANGLQSAAEATENRLAGEADLGSLVGSLLSYAFGCALGRWDVRMARDPRLAPKLADPFAPLPVCSPGMLVGPNGLPAHQGDLASEEWLRARPDAITLPPARFVERPTIADTAYPLRVAWDGILVDDPDHLDDVARMVREVFGSIWRDSPASIEQEACDMLGIADLRTYFGRPGLFFAEHLKRYSKSRRQAPIYWPLSTRSGSYSVWLYYPRLTSDTLFTAVNRYVQPKTVDVERQLRQARDAQSGATGREASRLLGRVEDLSTFLAELAELRNELKWVTELPYQPNLDDGVTINAAPLHKLFRLPKWAKDTREVWQKLEHGDYDWAHLAYTIWPDRVREKCRSDRSLAIAHDLEHLYSGPPPVAARKQRGRAAVATEVDDE